MSDTRGTFINYHSKGKLGELLNGHSAWLKTERSWVQILVMLNTHCKNELYTIPRFYYSNKL